LFWNWIMTSRIPAAGFGARRSWLAVVVAIVMAGPAASQSTRSQAPVATESIEIQARPVTHFQTGRPNVRRFGQLEFRGGLVLSSKHEAFGGWSGLTIDADGRRILAVSDKGSFLAAEISYRDDAPTGLVKSRIGPLLALKGRKIEKKRDLDAEALTLVEGNLGRGQVLVGFERNHRIGVFPVLDGILQAPVRYLRLPAEARRMRSNAGFEAVAVLKGGPFKGSVVAFAERYPGPTDRHTGWIWIKDVAQRLTLTDIGGFDITGAVSLPDGTLIVLERRFRWTEGVKMRIRRFEASTIKPGALLEGETLLEADMSSAIDNMEGLTAHRGQNGETVLTLISDDNFNTFLQRTLLLQFTVIDDAQAARRP
jgi:hypothetical protein